MKPPIESRVEAAGHWGNGRVNMSSRMDASMDIVTGRMADARCLLTCVRSSSVEGAMVLFTRFISVCDRAEKQDALRLAVVQLAFR